MKNGPIKDGQYSDGQYCTFHVAGLYFGVRVRQVQEVIRHQPMTPVPLAPPAVRGLINLRGQIVPAIDLRRRLGLPDADAVSEPPMNVVVRTADGVVSLLVDQIGEVLDLDPADYERPPETLTGVARACIGGVYKLPGRLMLALDTDQATNPGPCSAVAA